MNPYDKINELNDIAADLDDLRDRLLKLGNLNANVTGPIGDAITQIDQAVHWQGILAQDEPKSDFELGLERLAEKRSMTKVEVIDYAQRLARMQGGTAV